MADAFWSAPDSQAVWEGLPSLVREAIVRCDAEQLAVERSRVAPHLRASIVEPVYSVAHRFASWERVVRRMEPGWSSEKFYPISAYSNDLDSRDSLAETMRSLPAEAREGELGKLLAQLDARFRAQSVPDPEGSLRPWVRPTDERPEAGLGEWWRRKPIREPWS
ncbi:hypothetical protein ACQB60_10670 [Actinomycetota bacterium Odt1-20B]